jgi:hypothetical protein
MGLWKSGMLGLRTRGHHRISDRKVPGRLRRFNDRAWAQAAARDRTLIRYSQVHVGHSPTETLAASSAMQLCWGARALRRDLIGAWSDTWRAPKRRGQPPNANGRRDTGQGLGFP